ncbi:SRPBCC family protein [Saccharothrix carnea]|nr:SRPBCC family protein [Saccharothrix carnea]
MITDQSAPRGDTRTAIRAPARTARTKTIRADAEAVFDVITDVEHLSDWLPPGVEIELYGPGVLRLWPLRGFRDEPFERQVRIDWDGLRVCWGGITATTYTGNLRVLRIAPGCSAVSVELTGSAELPVPLLDDWLAQALDALAAVVCAERQTAPWTAGSLGNRGVSTAVSSA